MQMMLVDTAVTVPVNIAPLTDDTDFKSIEASVAYNAAGMALKWNFVTKAGVITQTAVTPTTAGDYDWSHVGGGMYKIEIPASGGGSINNDTEGYGYFSGVCDGVLPWRGPTIHFAPANIVNSLVDGSDLLDANASQLGGTAQTGNDVGADVDAILVDTNSLNDTKILQTLNLTASGNIGIDWANVENPTTTVGLSGTTVKTATDVEADTADIQTRIPAALTVGGYIKADALAIEGSDPTDTILGAIVNDATRIDASALNTLSSHDPGETIMGATDLGTGSGLTSLATASALATAQADLDTITGTDGATLATSQPNYAPSTHIAADVWAVATRVLTANTNLNDPTAAAIADAVWEELTADHSGTVGSAAESLAAASAAGDPWSTSLPGAYGVGTAGYILGTNLNATISSRLATASYTAPLDAADTRAALGMASADLDSQLDAILADTAEIGAAGAGLTAITLYDLSSTAKASVNTEVDGAIVTYGLDHLVSTSVTGTDVADNSIIAKMVSKSLTADWDSYYNVTDSQEGIFDALFDLIVNMAAVISVDGVILSATQSNYAPAVAGDQMDLVNAPNATAITAIQSGLATAASITALNDLDAGEVATAVWNAATATYGSAGSYGLLVETNLDATVSSRSSHTAANVVSAMQAVASDFKADVSGLATASALATAQSDLDILTGVDGVTLATLQPNYAPYTGTPPTVSQIRSEIDANSTQLAAIVADTGELQTDWADGGRLDLILDSRASQTSVDTVDTVVDAVLVDTGTTLPGLIGTPSVTLADDLAAVPTAAENAVGLLDYTDGVESSVTVRQSLRIMSAILAGIITTAGTGTEIFKGVGQSSGGTTRVTVTVDSSGNRSVVTLAA